MKGFVIEGVGGESQEERCGVREPGCELANSAAREKRSGGQQNSDGSCIGSRGPRSRRIR